jgi:hypothetical protein
MAKTDDINENIILLKSLIHLLDKTDLLYLNNMMYLFQFILHEKTNQTFYNDFEIFGRLGVSSSSLGRDYNLLLDRWEQVELKQNDLVQSFEKFCEYFKNTSADDIENFVYKLISNKYDNTEKIKINQLKELIL